MTLIKTETRQSCKTCNELICCKSKILHKNTICSLWKQTSFIVGRVIKSNKSFSLIETLDGQQIWIDRYTTRQIADPYKNICKFEINDLSFLN